MIEKYATLQTITDCDSTNWDGSAPKIAHSDTRCVVIAKPSGMPSHPLKEGEGGSALEWVVERFPEIANAGPEALEGGLIHRLDNDTSGLLLFARNPGAYDELKQALREERIKRSYLALVEGKVTEDFQISWLIAHHAKNSKKMVALKHSGICYFRGKPKQALTTVKPIIQGEQASLVRIDIVGGRRHQIRVHLAAKGFPLVGDVLYGGSIAVGQATGQCLHAFRLVLDDGTPVSWGPGARMVDLVRLLTGRAFVSGAIIDV